MKTTYPRWYGIYGIEFIYCGDWSDPLIRWGSYIFNSHIIEDDMYSYYKDYLAEYSLTEEDVSFEDYMYKNAYKVRELIKEAISLKGFIRRFYKHNRIMRYKAIFGSSTCASIV